MWSVPLICLATVLLRGIRLTPTPQRLVRSRLASYFYYCLSSQIGLVDKQMYLTLKLATSQTPLCPIVRSNESIGNSLRVSCLDSPIINCSWKLQSVTNQSAAAL